MPAPRSLRSLVVAGLLFTLIALSACEALPGSPSADDIADRMIAAQEDPRPIHSTSVMTLTFTVPGVQSADATVSMLIDTETWAEGPTQQRVEATTTMSTDDEILDGFMEGFRITTTAVQSEGTMWLLMQPQNMYVEMDLDDIEGTTVGPEQSAYMLREVVREIVNAYDITLLGTEEIAGTTAYKLQAQRRTNATGAESSGGEEANGGSIADGLGINSATLWVDPDTYAIRAMDADIRPPNPELQVGGEYRGHLQMRTIAYEIGAALPEGVFTFTPPEGATQIDADQFAWPGAAYPGP